MDTFTKWLLERGPLTAIGLALLAAIGFTIYATLAGLTFQVMGQEVGAVRPVPPPAVPETLPIGTVIAYYPTGASLPEGWIICDGTNGTPDLRNRFIRGVAAAADVGPDANATETHSHAAQTTGALEQPVYSTTQGSDDLPTTFNSHTHRFETNAASNIPPNFRLLYLMKVA